MIINKTKVLSESQILEIRELEHISFQEDQLENEAFLSGALNFYKEIPCFYLGYEENKLIAFLTTFLPEETEVEILAFTHPNHQKKGCFKQLLQEAIAVLNDTFVETIIFAVEAKSTTGNAVIKHWSGISFLRSEYRLSRKGDLEYLEDATLTVKAATEKELEIGYNLSKIIFESENPQFVRNAIEDPLRELFLVYEKDHLIGTFNLHYQNNQTFIYGVGIVPELRHKGYGKKMILHILKKAYKKYDIAILDVDSDNPSAYHLYINNGFQIDFQVDYYDRKLGK